jgi:hypothetical protein
MAGLSTGELVQVMDEVQASGMPMPACAAAVPMSITKPMAQLAEEIQGDHQEVNKSINMHSPSGSNSSKPLAELPQQNLSLWLHFCNTVVTLVTLL